MNVVGKFSAVALATLTLASCTSVQVSKLPTDYPVSHICIEENAKVTEPSFLNVVTKRIESKGFTTEKFRAAPPSHCKVTMEYTALRSWDFVTYLSHAEIRIKREGVVIADAEYHLIGKGGFDLSKWASTESKMNPVVDELLADYNPELISSFRSEEITISRDNRLKSKKERLLEAKSLYQEGLIDEDEYSSYKKKIMDS